MKVWKLVLLLVLCSGLHAEPIEFIVSASPGGPNDTVTRKIVDRLEKKTNLQFVIINKPGAAHTIAYGHVLNSTKPTLLLSTSEIESHEVFSHVDEIYNTGFFSNLIFVSKEFSVNNSVTNLKHLTQLSKHKEINFGHGGVGSYSYMAMQKLCNGTLRCLDVPYKSSAEGMMGLLTGTIDAYGIVSYGSKQFQENSKYVVIHNLYLDYNKSWFKLFAKNLSDKDKEIIVKTLRTTDNKFYTDMGFVK